MIRRLILENYMSHVRTVIEPAEGLTAIIGPNNCGKSAIIHALEMICYNSDAADFAIRHGTKKATVTVEIEEPDGARHTIVWWRKKETAGYVIDGREITGLGKGNTPDDLHKYLRMPKIEPSAGGEPFLLHFGLQKSPIFLLDETASRAAHFFASSSDADKLVEVQKRHAQKVNFAKRDKEKLDKELLKLDAQLQVLGPLSEVSGRLTSLEADYQALTVDEAAMGVMIWDVDAMERAEVRKELRASRVAAMKPLQTPPTVNDVGALQDLVQALDLMVGRTRLSEASQSVLIDLKPAPEFRVTTGLGLLCRTMAEAGSRTIIEDQRIVLMRPLREPPMLQNTEKLRLLAADIERSQARHHRILAATQALESLATAPVLADLAPLQDRIRTIEQAEAVESKRQVARREAEMNLTKLKEQIEQWVRANPRCETCGQTINSQLILSGGHLHD